MATAGFGFYGPSGDVAPTGTTFAMAIGSDAFVSYRKLGGTDDFPNTIDSPTVRAKKYTETVNTTTTTIAHGLVDENGNPVVPELVVQVSGPAAGDIMVSTEAPDGTNLYLSATTTGSYVFIVLY